MKYKAMSLGVALALAVPLAWGEASVEEYRAALADKDANPGLLTIDKGEILFKEKRGPKNASLEKCDFGLGAGKIKGAYAQMPRYFKDTNRVQDVESRLVTCMVKLQGFTEAEVKTHVFADQRSNEGNTDLEALTAYVAYQSNGMEINPPLKHPMEKETLSLGEALFWRRTGPMDFACSTCHAEDGKRIRLQPLLNVLNKKDIQATMGAWPTYRVSHGVVRTMEHRMWDCNWQMRTPDIDYGSPAAVALIAYLTHQASGGVYDLPGMKR
ncbi:MAG: sulfur oxidation c-type cytochrome SoxA [Thiobacillus sp.]|nr:sulfur oxidation c-type cytochrome SoxA [Thiobacillus sp.]